MPHVQPVSKAFKASAVAIAANSFVKLVTTGDPNDIIEKSGAGARAIGICQDGAPAGTTTDIDLPGGGSELKISATVTRGQFLKSDADGFGTPGTTAGDYCPALALESGAAGQVIQVLIHPVVIAAAE